MTRAIQGMAGQHRQRWAGRYLALLLVLLVSLAWFGPLAPDVFFFAAFVSYLVVVELTASTVLRPAWRRPLRWPARVGYLVFIILGVRFFLLQVQSGLA